MKISLFRRAWTRRAWTGATLIVASASGWAALPAAAWAADCPYCNMAITKNSPTQDNEVALKTGAKRLIYKCVYCAVADANTEYKGDLSISAPSEKKGRPIVLKRTGAKWTTSPATASFVMPAGKLKHRFCQVQSRAFSSPSAAAAYAKANNGEVVTLAQLIAQAD